MDLGSSVLAAVGNKLTAQTRAFLEKGIPCTEHKSLCYPFEVGETRHHLDRQRQRLANERSVVGDLNKHWTGSDFAATCFRPTPVVAHLDFDNDMTLWYSNDGNPARAHLLTEGCHLRVMIETLLKILLGENFQHHRVQLGRATAFLHD